MAVAFHDAGTLGAVATSATLTFSYTTTTGATFLLVRVLVGQNSATTISSVTYNGTSMFAIGTQTDDLGLHRVAIYGLRSPSIGTSNVVVTVSASSDNIAAWARSMDGVDTTSDASTYGTFVSENEATGDISLTVASASGDMAVDALAFYNGGGNTATVGAGQTSETNGAILGGSSSLSCSNEAATGSSVVMSWTGVTFYAYAAVAIKASAGGGGGATNLMGQIWI